MGLVFDWFQFSESGFIDFYTASLLDIIESVCTHELFNSLDLKEPVTGYHPIGGYDDLPLWLNYLRYCMGNK